MQTRALTPFAFFTNFFKTIQEGEMTRAREERLQIMLSPEELVVLDDFRFKQRMPSRAAAVRELLQRGLAAEGYAAALNGRQSKDFGVIGKSRSKQ